MQCVDPSRRGQHKTEESQAFMHFLLALHKLSKLTIKFLSHIVFNYILQTLENSLRTEQTKFTEIV